MDLIPGEETVNTAGPPFGGGISIPIRRYFLLLLLIHVCQFQNKESIMTLTGLCFFPRLQFRAQARINGFSFIHYFIDQL